METKDFMTVQDAAVYLELTEAGVRTAVHRGNLAYYPDKVLGRKVFPVSDLKRYKEDVKQGRPKKDTAADNGGA